MHARAALIVSLVLGAPALGQGLSIPWFTIDSGGGTLSAGPYTLSGTVGQHDAHAPISAGPYTLTGGFWPGVSARPAGCTTADLALPFGQLTFADISAFLAAFSSNDPLADLAAPVGQFTFADISAFLASFTAGCP